MIKKGCTVELPLPPSVNNSYYNVPGQGRVLTKVARDYKRDVKERLLEARWRRVKLKAPLSLSLFFYLDPQSKRDLSNMVKLPEDAVAEFMAYNDWQNYELHLYRRDMVSAECMVVRLQEVGGE